MTDKLCNIVNLKKNKNKVNKNKLIFFEFKNLNFYN